MTEGDPKKADLQDKGKAKDLHVSFPDWEKAKKLGVLMLDSVGITLTTFSSSLPVLLAGTGLPVPEAGDDILEVHAEFERFVGSVIQVKEYVPVANEPEFKLTSGVADIPDTTQTGEGYSYLTFAFPLVITADGQDEQVLKHKRKIEEVGKDLTRELSKKEGAISLMRATQSAASLLRNAMLLRRLDPEAYIVFPWQMNFDMGGSEPRIFPNGDTVDPYPQTYRYHIWYPPTEEEVKELREIEIGKLAEESPLGEEVIILGDTFDRIHLILPQRGR